MGEKGYLPRKTNSNSIPNEYAYVGICDSMEWNDREKIIEENNYKYTKEKYEKMGIKVIGECGDLFCCVELPEGWKIVGTDHHMWKNLIDDKGRARISFFYKNAYWDRDAFSNYCCRYSYQMTPFDDYKTDATYQERKFKPWKLFITDGGIKIKKLMEGTASTHKEYRDLDKKMNETAKEYLDKNYPDWNDVDAYWE